MGVTKGLDNSYFLYSVLLATLFLFILFFIAILDYNDKALRN